MLQLKKEYDAFLFDWDGTLAETLAVWLPITRELLKPYSIDRDDKTLVRQIFGRADVGFPELGVPKADLPGLFRKMDALAFERMPHAPLYEDVREVCMLLKQRGKKLGVITATVRPTIQRLFDEHGLHDIFDISVTGDEVKRHKPDPEGILFALEHLGIAKDRAIMFGDSEKDILAAHNAGIDSALFFPPQHEELHNLATLQSNQPTYTIHSWREVLNALQ